MLFIFAGFSLVVKLSPSPSPSSSCVEYGFFPVDPTTHPALRTHDRHSQHCLASQKLVGSWSELGTAEPQLVLFIVK